MLFFAVFCGFLAEYQLEHVVEHGSEKQYIQTLHYDLKDDTVDLNRDIPFWETQIKIIDTLRSEIKKGDSMNASIANRMATYLRDYENFHYHDRTIAQLKNSGNFRL